MKLKSFGCSFIFGTDLKDAGKNLLYINGSYLSWPALLAQHLNYDYNCCARPGSGNLQILEHILNQTAVEDPAVFVIGWTWIDRFDYIDRTGSTQLPGTCWGTIMPGRNDKLTSAYYKDLHSEYTDKLTTLLYIKLAIDILKQKNIPFIMTYIDELIFNQRWHTTPSILELQDYVQPYMTEFEGQTFLEWSKSNGFEISPTLHPLELAHSSAFELIKDQSFS